MSFERSGRTRARLSLRGVLIFSLPLVVLGVCLFGSAALDYYRIHQFDDWWSRDKHIDRFGFERVHAALEAPRAWSIDERLSPEDPAIEPLRIAVDAHEFERVSSDIGARWGEEIKADLESGGDLHPVALKLRGDTSVHWTTVKKSLTIKADRGRLYKGYRTLAFSCKDVLPAWLANDIPSEFNVLCATTNVVPLFLNQRFYGLFRFVEPLDESFLRRHILLPGNIFRGDAAERGEYFKGLERELFKNLYIWDRAAKNDRPGSIGTAAIGQFLTDLNGTTFEDQQRCMQWLDTSELARLFALQLAVGDPFHMSGVHNQFWYEDPSSGLLHPIAWDLRLLELRKPPPNSHYNRFLQTALRDPRMLDGAFAELARQLDGDRLRKSAARRMGAVAERFRDMIEYEHLREGQIPPIGSPAECLAVLDHNLEQLRAWLADARVAFAAGAAHDGLRVLDFDVRGFAGVDLAALELAGASAAPGAQLFADSDLDGAYSPGDREIACDVAEGRLVPRAPETLLPGADCSKAVLAPEPLHYRYFLRNAGDATIAPVLRNRHAPGAVAVETWQLGAPIRDSHSWHPWQYTRRTAEDVHLSGEMHIEKTLVVPAEAKLVIDPGTRLVLSPDVSILSRGRVEARGTAEQPIRIENAVERRPWGSLALQGAGANGSLFQHVQLRGGGGALVERVEYTGMVCVHNSYEVRFEDCLFDSNMRCDDMAHADRADLDLVRCTFTHANGDSIDYDMSGGRIEDCKIDRSANDGLDFMTCWPQVVGNQITNSDDKGISIGEASRPLIFDNEITGCNRGIEVKDTSQPLVIHDRLAGNKTGVRERLKNWRYGGGGWGKLVNTLVVENKTPLQLEPLTNLTLAGAVIGAPGAEGQEPFAPVDASWLLAPFGIRAISERIGPLETWERTEPIAPFAAQTFEEDFELPTDGWIHDRGVQLLAKRDDDLVATLRRGRGVLGREVDWDLTDASKRWILALEIGAEDLLAAEVRVERAGGVERAKVDVAGAPHVYGYTVLELPPARYTGLLLAADPNPVPGSGASRLKLHGWTLTGLPREAKGR